ncbi:PKD domain-containing protein [Pseudomonadota bacterium]
MQGLQRGVVSAVLLAWCVTSVAEQQFRSDSIGYSEPPPPDNVVIAQQSSEHISLLDAAGLSSDFYEVNVPGASFIKLHFSKFRLPEGVTLEISNPDQSESWYYSASEMDSYTLDTNRGDNGKTRFSAMSITGDVVQIRLLGDLSLLDPYLHAVEIDSYLEGLPLGQSLDKSSAKDGFGNGSKSGTLSVCGEDETYDAACWAKTNSWEYDRSAAVAKLITSDGTVCTAWRAGSDNRMFTAEHCLSSQSQLNGAEIWFNYESTSCGSSQTTTPVKVTGGTLLSNNASLDYALFTVDNFPAISGFPTFGLEIGTPTVGEPIFIPQHGHGAPRQIAIESDMNSSGECEVDAVNLDTYVKGSDIGYYCDTATSSSGSPVVSNISGRVVALHHMAGCMNRGVMIRDIWPKVSSYFDGEVPGGSSGGGSGSSANQTPSAAFSFQCDALSCDFDGSASSDTDGSIVEYSWAFGDGKNGSGASSSHAFSSGGDYDVTLTVKDNKGASANQVQTVAVSVPNEEPRASFSTVCVDNQCEFNGAGSTDPDGFIVDWQWELGDGSYARGQSVSHTYSKAGSSTIKLTVEDDLGATDIKYRTVNLSMPNVSPLASFSYNCIELDCTFDAGSSSDPDGNVTAWNWNFGDGGNASGSQTSHSFSGTGNYSVTVSVTDNKGSSSSSSKNVSVAATPVNVDPVANFSFNCNQLACTFDARSSSDPDGNITVWAWNFGDGSSASGSQTTHSFGGDGSYAVTLTVSDSAGAKNSRSRNLSVSQSAEQANQNPTSGFSFNCNDTQCAFNAAASSDPDGTLIAWTWTFGDGSGAAGEQQTHDFSAEGNYTVTLTVEDDNGATDTSIQTVSVIAEPTNQAPEARFTYECEELTCQFDASQSQDPDGNLVRYQWTLGDGSSASDMGFVYRFLEPGSFQVVLTVEDDKGKSSTRSSTLRVEKSPSMIILEGTGSRQNSRTMATLRWSGAQSATVELYRNDKLIATTPNDGKYIDTEMDGHKKFTSYRLCQPASQTCSADLLLSSGLDTGQ